MNAITVQSSPERILQAWNSQAALADALITGLEDSSASRADIQGSVDKLRGISKNLEFLHDIACKRADYEDKCCWFSYRNILVFSGTALDTTFQIVTLALWGKSVSEDTSGSRNSIAIASSTILSTIASKIKDWIWKRNEGVLLALAKMEEIIPNKLIIEHISSMAAFHESSRSWHNRRRIPDEKSLVHRSLSDVNALRSHYVVKLCGFYSRLDESEILKLTEQFINLKDLMVGEEEVIKEILIADPNGSIKVIIRQLEEQLKELESIFSDARHIIELSNQIEKTRARCVTNGFRVSIQLLLELGSLVGTIVEAVYANSGSSSPPAKVAAFSLYIANIALSWVNTGISKVREKDARIFQQIKRLDGQKIFQRHVTGMTEEARRSIRPSRSGGAIDEKPSAPSSGLMDRAPVVGAPMSPLRGEILKLYQESCSGGATQDWRKYLTEVAGGKKEGSPVTPISPVGKGAEIMSPRARKLTLSDLFIPSAIAVDLPEAEQDTSVTHLPVRQQVFVSAPTPVERVITVKIDDGDTAPPFSATAMLDETLFS